MRCISLDWHLPAEPAARLAPQRLQCDRQQARCHLLAAGNDNVIFRRIIQRIGLAAEIDQTVGLAWRLTSCATRLIRSVPAIDVPPNFITIRAINFPAFVALLQTAALIGTGYVKGKHRTGKKNYHRPKRGRPFWRAGR
jgi:hypothetical protein